MSKKPFLDQCQSQLNTHNLPVGIDVPHWQGAKKPRACTLTGRFTQLVPFDVKTHASALFDANNQDTNHTMWTYLPYGPFENKQAYIAWAESVEHKTDPQFFCITDSKTNAPLGLIALARIACTEGSIEIAHLAFSPKMQKTVHSTEAVFLLLHYVFELGFRRAEWKCNALNQPSINAALRLGFTFEGTFRNHMVVKGQNRDTCWFSIIENEWVSLVNGFEKWLNKKNIDENKIQKRSLKQFLSNRSINA